MTKTHHIIVYLILAGTISNWKFFSFAKKTSLYMYVRSIFSIKKISFSETNVFFKNTQL